MKLLLDSSALKNAQDDAVLTDSLEELRNAIKEAGRELDTATISTESLKSFANFYDFIITENREIHEIANKFGIIDKILLIDEALQIFKGYVAKESIIAPPALKSELVGNLDYHDPIFDSLKEKYPDFEPWFKKISGQGRRSWVYYRKDGHIGALLIYKFEDESIADANPSLPKRKRLKIATLKVNHIGYKIGELFIKMAVDISIRKGVNEIYLTHFTEPRDSLIELVSEFGFEKIATKDNGEDIFVKRLVAKGSKDLKDRSPIEISKRFYPSFYDGDQVKKFLVPIQPIYHEKLFTDFFHRQTTLLEHSGNFIIEGNTIKKAYLSHSSIKKMVPGDLILFYRSGDLQAITSIGVVESTHIGISDPNEILKLVGKRTVFSRDEINDLVRAGPVSVFLFRHHHHLTKPLGIDQLVNSGILKGAPQSAMSITEGDYIKIKNIGGVDGRFVIH